MSEQQPVADGSEPGGNSNDSVRVDTAESRSEPERFFNNEVHEHAIHHGWRPFHVDRFRVIRGRGFPDLAMFRKHPETGEVEMLVAELKRDAESEFGEGQKDWLEAFNRMGITTKVWLGSNPDDRREMYDIIENGTAGHGSVTELPTVWSSSPIPANFRVAIDNIIESIESPEMTTGQKASLRRMDPANPGGATFWKLMSQRGMPRKAGVKEWGLIMHGIAMMSHGHGSGRGHDVRMPVGRALYLGGESQPGARGFYSEDRLSTLLSARGPALHSLLSRLFRMLSSESRAFNWREMAWFILNTDHNEDEADQSRIEIARAYYSAQRRSQQQET